MLYFLRRKLNSEFRSTSAIFIFIFILGIVCTEKLSAQQTHLVNFLKIEATVEPNATKKEVKAHFIGTFQVLKDTDSIFMDAVNISPEAIKSKKFKITANDKKLWLIGDFEKGKTYQANFQYRTKPKQTLYFFGNQIWTQGQGKYTSHWLPSIDDVNDKIEFDLTIIAALEKTVISNGELSSIENKNNKNHWHFNMEQPMSSYLVAFAIGDFDKKELISNSGIPIQLYYKTSDSTNAEPTYRYSKQIFDFLETEIGVPYPWQNYKQVPVRDFLYAGMENTTATFFSEAFMVDTTGFNDRNYINVNAHELAHQWFGNLITEKTNEDHWLQEGFATYYALLAEREIFGDDYYYWQLYQTAEQLKAASDAGKGESLLNAKASSLTFYQKGAWALHILREQIGDEAFKTAIKNYLEKYKFQNVSNTDFLNEVRAISEVDISKFEKDWLHQSAFKAEEAYQSLLKSSFIHNYFEISALRATAMADKKHQLKTALTFPNDFIGQEAIYQLTGAPISETLQLYKKAFESNNLYVRQVMALSLETIPKTLQKEYETLLNDESYVTMEAALYQLAMQFPEKRSQYLDKTIGIDGFQNKNIRQLWLVLALITEDYKDAKKYNFLNELKNYTSTQYSFEVRQKAFEYVAQLNLWDAETLKNLVEACVHPTWRFAKASKALLKNVLREKENREQVKALENEVSEKALNYLNTIVN
ncbi:M1 family metallopeptidase [Aequorivita marina]|uniref:M1 family metallopeptidase n=1 Tax=Aequorivita marina TaxID=3073654 RepID=UPI002874F7A4|nr:M1 family metallopeptidase [Aequorivita sp. S2608]MDS1299235.1 M1 family metallopeptidase [Aequorivita sp. S2608]